MSSGLKEHKFLFASLGSKRPSTTRQFHIRRLYDILQLCIQRRDYERAKRAWAILARCKEMEWRALWPTGLVVLDGNITDGGTGQDTEFLRMMMLQRPEERQTILKELVFRLLLSDKCREALDEIELYLPTLPYQDDPVLHTYAGLCSMYLACNHSDATKSFDHSLLREAQTHLEHAQLLDPQNLVAHSFLEKIRDLKNEQEPTRNDPDTDDDDMPLEVTGPSSKRRK